MGKTDTDILFDTGLRNAKLRDRMPDDASEGILLFEYGNENAGPAKEISGGKAGGPAPDYGDPAIL